MRVRSQNAWPSLRRDLMALTDRFDRFLPVGFYYKTFIRPRALWPLYERVLRHAAGLGRVDVRSRPELHPRKRHVHADVAVIGGGPAGCLAALEAASRSGRGSCSSTTATGSAGTSGSGCGRSPATIGSTAASGTEAATRLAELVAAEPRIEHLARATAIGIYEGGLVGVLQGDAAPAHPRAADRRRDRRRTSAPRCSAPTTGRGSCSPRGSSASGTSTGSPRASAWSWSRTTTTAGAPAAELREAGFEVAALVDARDGDPGRPDPDGMALAAAGVSVLTGSTPLEARGRSHVEGLVLRTPRGTHEIVCDLVAMAMRPEPAIALLAGSGAVPRFDEALGEWLADRLPDGVHAAGHVLGLSDDAAVAASGVRAGRAAAGHAVETRHPADRRAGRPAADAGAGVGHRGRSQAVRVPVRGRHRQGAPAGRPGGVRQPRDLKRYSTVTMGPCQGKMCHGLAARVHARFAGRTPASTSLTTYRPPFQPVPLAVLAGPHLAPIRRTAMHDRHEALGARWIDMGDWKRPFALR